MVAQKKIFTVQNLTEKINDAKALYLADYRGLDVAQMTDLRKAVKDAGGELEVVKNRLFKLALKGSVIKIDLDKLELTGPTAILWVNEDEISPLRALAKFSEENDLPELKIGFLDKEFLEVEEVKKLSLIPSRNNLETKLVGIISSPTYGLVNALNWNLKGLVWALKSMAEEKN